MRYVSQRASNATLPVACACPACIHPPAHPPGQLVFPIGNEGCAPAVGRRPHLTARIQLASAVAAHQLLPARPQLGLWEARGAQEEDWWAWQPAPGKAVCQASSLPWPTAVHADSPTTGTAVRQGWAAPGPLVSPAAARRRPARRRPHWWACPWWPCAGGRPWGRCAGAQRSHIVIALAAMRPPPLLIIHACLPPCEHTEPSVPPTCCPAARRRCLPAGPAA